MAEKENHNFAKKKNGMFYIDKRNLLFPAHGQKNILTPPPAELDPPRYQPLSSSAFPLSQMPRQHPIDLKV